MRWLNLERIRDAFNNVYNIVCNSFSYMYRYSPLQDQGVIRWYWFGHWPLLIITGMFMAMTLAPLLDKIT